MSEKRGSLEVGKCQFDQTCDGCGEDIPHDEASLLGIESCCGGGCSRTLCHKCVEWAYQQCQKEFT